MKQRRIEVPTEATLYHLDVPLVQPFETASGRVTMRTVGLVSITRDGVSGWGEASPYPGQDEPFDDVLSAARAGCLTQTLAAAIGEAACDLDARERGETLTAGLGTTTQELPISLAIGMDTASHDALEIAVASGVTRVKVKVMPQRTDHVVKIRRRFPELSIGVDANASFDASNWNELLALADSNIEYVEQPFSSLDCPEVDELAESGLLVFADESVRSQATADEALNTPGVGGVVVKPGRLGWKGSVDVVALARSAGKKWRASGLLETGIGRAYTEALASLHDAYLSDIAPAEWFFTYDIVSSRATGGFVSRPEGDGSGIEVDTSLVRDRAQETISLSGSVVQVLG